MEKEFIPYEQALALKELGFDEPCFKVYDNMAFLQEESVMNTCEIECDCVLERYLAPLYQQAFRWFREKYEYNSYISEAKKSTYRFIINKFDEKYYNSDILKLYEQAELECLKKLIEIVKNTL